jgi:hypothetical protein
MAAVPKPVPDDEQWFSDKEALLRILEENDARTGFVFDPTATPEQIRELMRAQGIRPEDNLLSRDIIRARYEDAA